MTLSAFAVEWLSQHAGIEAFILAFLLVVLGELTVRPMLHGIRRALWRLARHRRIAVIALAALAFGMFRLELAIQGIPQPAINDEFSYLLAADTFNSGRLSTPPHPLWMHFESMHILQQPRYASMYPPAQGVTLALGKELFGEPFLGVGLSIACLCGTVCWALQAWMPPGWAFCAGLIVITRFSVLHYWARSYWGGAVAATGGCLLVGAYGRLLRRMRVRDSIVFGIGLAVLACSRPYEGLAFSIPLALHLGQTVWKDHQTRFPEQIVRKILPAALVIAACLTWLGYYNRQITGSAFLSPHTLNRRIYAIVPFPILLPLRPPPPYRHEAMRQFFVDFEPKQFDIGDSLRSLPGLWMGKLWAVVRAYYWQFLWLALPALPWAMRGRAVKALLPALMFAFLALFLIRLPLLPHYAAPMTAALYVVEIQCIRHLRLWSVFGFDVGRHLVRVVILGCVLYVVVGLGDEWSRPVPFAANPLPRSEVLAQLEHVSGPQLVIVRYGPRHSPQWDWVYNAADIDRSKVVWAREMAPAENAKLLAYFHDRKKWLLYADNSSVRLIPYPQ